MLEVELSLNGQTLSCKVKFKDGMLAIHFPKESDVPNWYHSVVVKKDIEK